MTVFATMTADLRSGASRPLPVEKGFALNDVNSILARVAGGDRTAVAECLDRYGGLVWSLARRFCSEQADAEDAVQDIFIDLWRNAGRYDSSVAQESTFVAMIARRRLIDRLRRAGRRPPAVTLDDEPELQDHDAADAMERTAESTRVAALIGKLSPDQQRVLRLSIFHGLSHGDIVTQTGLPLGTVKTHIRRGLIAIRQELELGPSGAEAVS